MYTYDNHPLTGFGAAALTATQTKNLTTLYSSVYQSFLNGNITDDAYKAWITMGSKLNPPIVLPPHAQAAADRKNLTGLAAVNKQFLADKHYQEFIHGKYPDNLYKIAAQYQAQNKITMPSYEEAVKARAAMGAQPPGDASAMQVAVETGVAEETDNTLLYVGIAAGVLVLGGGVWYFMHKKKQSEGK